MVVVWLSQLLFGAAALLFCAVTCRAVLRHDRRAHFWLTLAGSLALVFFVTIPGVPAQMIGVAVAAILAGVLMTPAEHRPVALDSTATRKSRRR